MSSIYTPQMALTAAQRSEVVRLIYALTPPQSNVNPDIETRLTALEANVTTLTRNVGALAQLVSGHDSHLRQIDSELVSLSGAQLSLDSRVTDAERRLSTLSEQVDALLPIVTSLQSWRPSVDSSIASLQTSLSETRDEVGSHSLAITDLSERVAKLEQSGGVSLTVDPPLQLSSNRLTLLMDPSFVSAGPSGLTQSVVDSLSSSFEWTGSIVIDGGQSPFVLLTRYFKFATAVTFLGSSNTPFTVSPGREGYLRLRYAFTNLPADVSPKLFSINPGFAFSAAFADLVYVNQRTSEMQAFHTTLRCYDDEIRVQWPLPVTDPVNVTIRTLRFTVHVTQ
ncbi:SigmaC [Duck reovirus]|nr:SigmaC [Duck reovirus]